MSDQHDVERFAVDLDNLPMHYPTYLHPKVFWEALGRTVATFGFLEETLGKAIFSFTATREYSVDELEAAYKRGCRLWSGPCTTSWAA